MIGTWFGSQNLDWISGPFLQFHFLGGQEQNQFPLHNSTPRYQVEKKLKRLLARVDHYVPQREQLTVGFPRLYDKVEGSTTKSSFQPFRGIEELSILGPVCVGAVREVRNGCRVTWIRLHSRGMLITE